MSGAAPAMAEMGEERPLPPRVQEKARTCDCSELKRRFEQVKALRAVVEQVWFDIEAFFEPLGSGSRPSAQILEGGVEWRRPDVWDSTAIDAKTKLQASIHGSVTSPAIRWFKLQWRDQELKDDQESATWLDNVGDRVFECLQDSDFNTEIASADGDLVGYGNCFVFEEPASELEWKGVDFEAIPIREAFFEADSQGDVEIFYRWISWSAVQILHKFGPEGTPERIRVKAEKGESLDERFEVVFCVFRRAELADKPVVYPAAPHLRPWGFCYFLRETGDCLGEEGGYYERPVMLAQWAKTAGSVWGHGPCNILLPTVKYLNAYMETDHAAAAKVVDPATLVTERGLLSDLDLEPGGVTVVRDVEKDVKIHESKARFDVSERKLQELRAMIRSGLHNDELTLKDSPAMTATEVQARYELMNRILGSTLARIENGLLSPIVKTTLGHLARANQLPRMPQKVAAKFQLGQAEFNIEYQGPLSRAQRTDEVAAIERVLSFAAALLKMGIPLPVVMATIDVVSAIREVAKRLGTPADLLKPPEEVQKAVKELNELQARAAAAQVAQQEGQAALAHGQALQARNEAAAGAGARPAAPGAGGVQGLPVPARPGPIVAPPYGPVRTPIAGVPAEEQPA